MPSPWSFGAEVRVVGSMHGEEIIQVLHFATNETINDNPDPGGTLLLQLLNALLACAQTKLLPFANFRILYLEPCGLCLFTPFPKSLLRQHISQVQFGHHAGCQKKYQLPASC